MSHEIESAQGSCRCGQVIFATHGQPLMTSACHCTGCQKMSSSAFSLSALFPAERFVVIQGSPVIGGLHGETKHYFCPNCLTWLFTRPAANQAIVGIRSSLMDNPPRYAPFMETWTAEKMPWVTTGAMHSYAGFPEPQDYPQLMRLFAHKPLK